MASRLLTALSCLLPIFLINTQIQFHVHVDYVKTPTTQQKENNKS